MSLGKKLLSLLRADIRLQPERENERERMTAIRAKAEQAVNSRRNSAPINHYKASTADYIVTIGVPCAIENEPILVSLVELAWASKATFPSFVNKVVLGQPPLGAGKFTLTQPMINELMFLNDIVLEEFGISSDLEQSFHVLSPQQAKVVRALTGNSDPWDHIDSREFNSQVF